jgi:hypothetical protein
MSHTPPLLLFDPSDLPDTKKLRDQRFEWLIELGAREISEVPLSQPGFLFGYERGDTHHRRLVADRPEVRDRPEERQELVHLDDVLARLDTAQVDVPRPRTWRIGVDDQLPDDLTFPVFVRTPRSSWKRGGTQGRAGSRKQLVEEMEQLRRVFGWDTPILAREWIEVAKAGSFMFGDAPQEVRVWIVDRQPAAWAFHYLHAVGEPAGFPPSADGLALLKDYGKKIASAFASRLIAADFVRDQRGCWHFLEAGPGAVAGTAHQRVFQFVAERIRGVDASLEGDAVGGPL